jgi:hypothetical protein
MSMRGSVAKSGANLRRRTIRRRVIALGVAGVTIAGAQIGVSMLGDTGSVDAAVTPSNATGKHIYADALPSATGTWASGVANAIQPTNQLKRVAWSATPASTGFVSTAGDVAVIDATTESLPTGAHGLTVSMFISNLAGFGQNYSSFALPVGVYQWKATSATAGTWTQYVGPTGAVNNDFYTYTDTVSNGVTTRTYKNSLFISDTDGLLTLNLPAVSKNGDNPNATTPSGATGFYEIVIDKTGGFWQSVSSFPSSASADLGPAFYLTSANY